MKANELRIGNLINYEQTTHVILSVSTTESDEYAESRWIEEKGVEYYFHTLDLISPIPLTEEWLIKFGFAYDGDEWSNYNEEEPDDWHISLGDDRGNIYYTYEGGLVLSRYIESVHQLQNLYFALTGEELELKQ